MTGYQETLTDPSYHRQVVVQTAPHIGNTGVNDEDPESRGIWVAGYVVRDPARRASNWRAAALAATTSSPPRASSASAASTPARSPGTCASAARCAAASPASTCRPRRLLAKVRGVAADGRRGPVRRGHDRRALPGRRDRHAPVHRRRARLRHQGDDPAPDGRSAASPRTCCPRPARPTTCSAPVPTRCSWPTARATRPPPTTRWPPCATCCAARSRCSASASATRCSAGRSASAPTSSATVTAASTSRCRTAPPARSRSPRTTTASRSTPRSTGSTDTEFGAVEVSHVCLNDDVVEGAAGARRTRVQRAVPPGGRGRAARRRLPVRSVRGARGRDALDAQAHGHRAHPGHRLAGRSSSARPASSTTPAPRPAGCCAARDSGSAWSTPTRRRS